MGRIFGDIANCKNQRDDIIIGGKSEDKHEEALQKIFFLSNIKFYRDKVPKHYKLLDYNTKTEPRMSKI